MFDDGPVTILPRRAPVGNSGPIRGHTVAVFPGAVETPASPPRQTLLQASVEPGDHAAFAVLDVSEDEATDLGKALGLTEILFWDGRRARLLPCGTA